MTLAAELRLERGDFRLAASLRAPAGAVTAVFGPSGAGKSTLLAALAGLARARGRCVLGGAIWQDDAAGSFLAPHARPLGMVFQDAALLPHLTVAGNLDYAARRRGTRGQRDEVVAKLDLGPLLDRRPDALSGGERQRVALGRALLCAPQLLLLDEPLSSLDARRKEEILPYLEAVVRTARLPVLYVTHSVAELCRLADHVVPMAAGATGAAAPLAEALARLDGNPLSGEATSSLLLGVVRVARDAHELMHLECCGQTLLLPASGAPVGSALRVRVQARDVSVALEKPRGSSILNILRGRICELRPEGHGQALLALDLGGTTVLARVSALSVDRLSLRPGLGVYLQVKALALA